MLNKWNLIQVLDIKQDNLQKYKTKTDAQDGDERSIICLTSFRKKGENYKKILFMRILGRQMVWIRELWADACLLVSL